MAEQKLTELFEGLSGVIGSLATNVDAQGVGTKIEVYSGEPRGFKERIKSIEKYALLTNTDGAQAKHIPYQASKGAVSDFIHHYITANPNNTWNQLKMNFQLDSQISRIDGAQTKHIPYQTSKGAVSNFIHHYITANPNNTWNQLKNELSARFSDIQDSQHAFTLLRQTKQKLSEAVQVYAKRLFALAQEAFAHSGFFI